VVPVLFELGPLTLYTFGAMMALAFLVAGSVVAMALEEKGIDPDHAWSILFWAAVGGIVGSRLLVIFDDWQGFLEHPITYLISGSGFIWYGGLVGGCLSITLYLRQQGLRWLLAVDAIAPALALGHAIGRIGCQISGDGDWGKPTQLPWGMAYPEAVIGWTAWLRDNGLPPDVRVHPAPVYETILYSGIFVVLWSLRGRGLRAGSLLWIYLLLSSIARFLVEIIRVEPVIAGGLTQAQWFAIFLSLVSLGLLAWSARRAEEPAA
jgi:phosphatidylglycerol---prolipoprotein diacylglyceryl transferase